LLNRIQRGNEFSDNLTEMVDYITYSIEENK
jgi:hypothetical protein